MHGVFTAMNMVVSMPLHRLSALGSLASPAWAASLARFSLDFTTSRGLRGAFGDRWDSDMWNSWPGRARWPISAELHLLLAEDCVREDCMQRFM